MKLYIAAGRYVGTQAEARKLDPKHDGKPVEFRTDKEGMIEDLNALVERARQPVSIAEGNAIMAGMEWQEPPAVSSPPAQIAAAIEATRDRHAEQARAISIEEAIAEADYPRAIRLAEHIHCRLMEHARAGESGK